MRSIRQTSEARESTERLLSEIVALRVDVDLRRALSVWRSHLLKRSFERLASDIDPESGFDSAMARLHHHFAVELPITEIGTILPSDESAVAGVENLDPTALRPLFSVRETIAASGHSDETKFELGEMLRNCLSGSVAAPLTQYQSVAEAGLQGHCPGTSLAARKDDGGFDFSEIIDRIAR